MHMLFLAADEDLYAFTVMNMPTGNEDGAFLPARFRMLMRPDFGLSANKLLILPARFGMHVRFLFHRLNRIAVLCMDVTFAFFLPACQFPDGGIAFQGMDMPLSSFQAADQAHGEAVIRMLMFFLAVQHQTQALFRVLMRSAFLEPADRIFIREIHGGIAVLGMYMAGMFFLAADKDPDLFSLRFRSMFFQFTDQSPMIIAEFIMDMVILF